MLMAYQRATQLKNQYGSRISGEIVERCLRAATGGADSAQAEAEIRTGIDILEGRTPLGSGLEVQGLLETTSQRQPEYAVRGTGGRRLVEVKRMTGTSGNPLSTNTIGNNLRSALGQIRSETQAGDAGGMIRLDGSDAAPTALNIGEVSRVVERKLNDAIRPDASGNPTGVNVQYIEIIYQDAAGADARLVFEIRYDTITTERGSRLVSVATPLGQQTPSSASGSAPATP